MTLLHNASEAKKFDVRVIERHVARGLIALQDVEKNAKALPDDADNAEYTSVEELAAEDNGSN